MECHMIHEIYMLSPMHPQTEKMTFSCKDEYGKSLQIYWSNPVVYYRTKYHYFDLEKKIVFELSHSFNVWPLKKKNEFCATYRVLHIPSLRNFCLFNHFASLTQLFDIHVTILKKNILKMVNYPSHSDLSSRNKKKPKQLKQITIHATKMQHIAIFQAGFSFPNKVFKKTVKNYNRHK